MGEPASLRVPSGRRTVTGHDAYPSTRMDPGGPPAGDARTDGIRFHDADLRETRGALALVVTGFAVDVVLCGLQDPARAAAVVGPECRAEGVALRLETSRAGHCVIVVGPRQDR